MADIPCVRQLNESGKRMWQWYAIDIPCVRQLGWPSLVRPNCISSTAFSALLYLFGQWLQHT